MVLGAMTHVALRVSDRPRSEAFYDRVLGLLGYRRTAQTDGFTMWWSPRAGAITISAVSPGQPRCATGPGLHHLAFTADSRDQVDAFHRHLQTLGVPVLKGPAIETQPNLPTSDYYAVLFSDPDGLCLELVYMASDL